jgi:hypothetical protein
MDIRIFSVYHDYTAMIITIPSPPFPPFLEKQERNCCREWRLSYISLDIKLNTLDSYPFGVFPT